MKRAKQIAAIVGIVFIASMYIISLISAFFATEKAPGLFLASVFCTLVIPILIYLFLLFYKLFHKNEEPENPDRAPDEKDNSNDYLDVNDNEIADEDNDELTAGNADIQDDENEVTDGNDNAK